MVLSQLRAVASAPNRVQFDSFDAVRGEIAVVLSALAHFSATDSATAFAAGVAQLPVLANQIALLDAGASGLEQFDTALDKLAVSSLPIKKRLLVAAGHVIASDGSVTSSEGELYRALVATLDVPMPQLAAS